MLRHMLLAGAAGTTLLLPVAALSQSLPGSPAPDGDAVAGGVSASVGVEGDQDEHGQSRRGDEYHSPDDQAIVVTGFVRNRADLLSGTTVVSGEELARELRPTIGETLSRQPGVSATSFGPNASRPVLRGFQGERVRVLTDGIGSLDASNTSADHAVAINPLPADRIEVLRGPAALLFGSSAIGGVVNIVDSRIPRRVPEEAVHAEGILSYGSAANELTANSAVDVPLGEHLVVHFDGNYTNTDDLEIGGFVLTPALRAQAAASADPGIRQLAELRGRLPNTASETSEFAGGFAWIDGDNHAGVSVSRYDSRYGVPVRYSLEPAAEAEQVRLDLKQTRVDARAEIDTGDGFIDSLRFRGGYSDYRHFELEETGEIATTFNNQGVEARLEARQSPRGSWGGGFGAQYFERDFAIVGEEKFLPPSRTRQIGLFALQTFDLGAVRAEAGARYEHSDVRADADADLGNPGISRSFDAFTGSIGGSVELAPRMRLGLNLTRSERAPAAEELFANGPHAGTQSFEIGDPTLSTEKSWGIEGTLRASGEGYEFGASVFHSWFDGYIYELPTGAFADDLPVFQYFQDDARYYGVEFEASFRVARIGGVTLNLDAVADYVHATIEQVGPAPRIPPVRLLGGIEAQSDKVDGRIEVEWVGDQDRIADFETPTHGYTMVNASLSFHPFASNDSSIILSANNLFDVDARRHASFLKDFAPLAGRDFRITTRVSF
ncbi:MAG: TonB-dependent receptor [Allosphingosinicella sp.]